MNRLFASLAMAFAMIFSIAPMADAVDLLNNGNFANPGTAGQLTVNTTVTDWTGGGKEGIFGSPTTPPVFLFTSATGASGVTGDGFMGTVGFYNLVGPSNNANFIAAAGDSTYAGSISQTVSGLTLGQQYTLAFEYAGAQQTGFGGATTEKWQITFGSETQSTTILNLPSQSFSGWQSDSMTFTASSTAQTLTFLAVGTPDGQQPWLLLSNVSLTPVSVPEPATYVLGLVAAAAVSVISRKRKMQLSA